MASPALQPQPQPPTKPDWLELTFRLATSWIGALTAYVVAVVLALTNLELLEKGLSRFGLPTWAVILIIAAFPALAFVVSTLPKFLEDRRIRRYSELTGAIQPGYFTLRPRTDEATFTRADNAHHEILRWMQHTSEPVLYLTGASGTGKSSILSAWVLPKLKQEKHRVIQLRGYEPDLPARIKEQLLEPGFIWEKPPANLETLSALIQRAMQRLAPSGSRLFIVIDQFEELLILADSERQNTLSELLRTTSIPNLSFLLVYRPEYEGFLEADPWPQLKLDTNRKVIRPFTESAAKDFIDRSGLAVNPDLLRGVLREAAEIDQTAGLIRPVTLNLCGLVLSRFTSGLPHRFRGSLIRGFLRESLSLPEVRDVANQLIPHFITGDITKQPRTLTDLANATHVAPFTIRACLRRLGEPDRGILRPIDQNQQTWEISHDFLVPLLDKVVARRTVSWWRSFRPWLPWTVAGLMGFSSALLPSLTQDEPTIILRKLGWQISENKGVLVLTPKSRESLRPDGLSLSPATVSLLSSLPYSLSLELAGTSVSDLSPISDLKNLTSLNLMGTKVSDLSPIKDLAGLEHLDLFDTRVSNLYPIKDFKRLKSLNLSGTNISDLSALEHLSSLRSLYLSATKVLDLSPLRGLVSLSAITLDNTAISDLSPLKDLQNLSELHASVTQVSDLSAVKGLKSLISLELASTPVFDLSPLKDLKSLGHLQLAGTRAVNFSPIKNLENLRILSLRLTSIKELSALSGLHNLTHLDLYQTEVYDVAPLKHLKNLTSLDLIKTKVSDLSPLRDLKNLTFLDLTYKKEYDLSPLKGNKKLKILRG